MNLPMKTPYSNYPNPKFQRGTAYAIIFGLVCVIAVSAVSARADETSAQSPYFDETTAVTLFAFDDESKSIGRRDFKFIVQGESQSQAIETRAQVGGCGRNPDTERLKRHRKDPLEIQIGSVPEAAMRTRFSGDSTPPDRSRKI